LFPGDGPGGALEFRRKRITFHFSIASADLLPHLLRAMTANPKANISMRETSWLGAVTYSHGFNGQVVISNAS
jgi:hypothetical protein